MKKTITSTFLLIGFMASAGLIAQNLKSAYQEKSILPEKSESTGTQLEKNTIDPAFYQFAGDTLWKEDFGTTTTGGIPAGWAAAGTDPLWRKTTKVTTGVACFYGSSDKLKSTSELNGTLIFDGDSANKAGGGTCTGAGYTQKIGSVTTGAINLTGNSDVILKFQHRFRLCCNTSLVKLTVSVSGDGGATFTNLPDARGTVSLNQNPLSNPAIYVANISSIAGNKSDVRIRFTFDNTSLGVYYWELDDIVIVKAWDHELNMSKAITDFYYKDGGYYTQTPINQVAPLVSFRGIVKNEGANIQTNVKLNVDIKNGTTGVYNQNSPVIASFAKGLADTLDLNTPYTPTAKGIYTTTFQVQQTETDNVPSNNTIIKTFEVNDSVYGRDDGIITASTISSSNYVGGNVDGSMLANIYEMNKNDVATSISVYLGSNTNSSSAIYAHIFKVSATGVIGTAPLISSNIYDILDSTQDAGKWVTLMLNKNGGENLMKDSTYLAAIESSSETTKKVRISSDLLTEQPNATSFVKVAGGTTPGWGWITVQPRIRLNLKGAGVGISETAVNGSQLYQNYPNPFARSTRIDYEISKKSNVKLEVFDIAGKRVFSLEEGSRSAGSHSIVLDKNFEAGVYFYTLTVDGDKMTRKMTVTK